MSWENNEAHPEGGATWPLCTELFTTTPWNEEIRGIQYSSKQPKHGVTEDLNFDLNIIIYSYVYTSQYYKEKIEARDSSRIKEF